MQQQKRIFQLYDKDIANSVTFKLPYLSLLEKQNRLKEAFEFYLLSAKENHVESALKVGQFYEKGKEISSALKFITNNFIEYEDINDMINKVRNFIIER